MTKTNQLSTSTPMFDRSAYIHIPFCEHICYYCDFNKVFLEGHCRAEDGTKYVDDSGYVDTFGENLFTLLHSSFYLRNGEIGEIAKQKIQNVIDFLTRTQEQLEVGKLEDAAKEDACRELQRHRDETVILLADGPIKAKLRLELNHLEEQLISSRSSREYFIQALEAKLRYLKGEEGPV